MFWACRELMLPFLCRRERKKKKKEPSPHGSATVPWLLEESALKPRARFRDSVYSAAVVVHVLPQGQPG